MAAGIAALRRFYRPFFVIQLASVLLVVAYYASERVRSVCVALASVKTMGGLAFAAVTAAFAGGVVPELAKYIANVGRARAKHHTLQGRRSEILFNLVFFAFNGVVIDLLYRLEARLFGMDTTIGTIVKKAAFDQFVFNPVWLPLIVALFLWRNSGFSLAVTLRKVRARGFYRTSVVPLLLPSWCFWLPMVAIIYALPVPLQFLLFILALAAWSLIMLFIANRNT